MRHIFSQNIVYGGNFGGAEEGVYACSFGVTVLAEEMDRFKYRTSSAASRIATPTEYADAEGTVHRRPSLTGGSTGSFNLDPQDTGFDHGDLPAITRSCSDELICKLAAHCDPLSEAG